MGNGSFSIYACEASPCMEKPSGETDMQFLVVVWICSAVVATVVGSQRRAALGGCFFGLLLGPLGIFIACLLDERFNCPQCGARLNGDKQHPYPLCPYCKTELVWTQCGPRAASLKPIELPVRRDLPGPPRHDEDDKDDLERLLKGDSVPPKFDEWGRPLQQGGCATLIRAK